MSPNIACRNHRTQTSPESCSRYANQTNFGQKCEDFSWTDSKQLFFISAYSDFKRLAHGPRGSEATRPLYVYRFDPSDGSMLLLNIFGDKKEVVNPAFSRFHPRLNIVYTCTEDVEENGRIIAYSIDQNGFLRKIDEADAGGKSTCYITIDHEAKNMLICNYWDSTLSVIPLSRETGKFLGPIKNTFDPRGGRGMVAATKGCGGCNHSINDASTIMERQKDPHSHALVLDPFVGCIAYVPDLGKDIVRELFYDAESGTIQRELCTSPSSIRREGKSDGPRYIVFHPSLSIAYVVNELSSSITVFSVNNTLLNEISRAAKANESMDRFQGRSTLTMIQTLSTVPEAFPTDMNTCGRICVHQSGRFVLVCNRGHDSLAIFRVFNKGACTGQLQQVGFFHTRGETPRHFQFDTSGQYLIVANQDSNSIAIFSFNLSSGQIKYTGNEYDVPSPNFVCSCSPYDNELRDKS